MRRPPHDCGGVGGALGLGGTSEAICACSNGLVQLKKPTPSMISISLSALSNT